MHVTLHIDLLGLGLSLLRFDLFLPLNEPTNLVQFFRFLLCATSESLLRKDEVASLRILALFNGIQHVVLYSVLAFQLEDVAVLQPIDYLFVWVGKLELSVGVLYFIANGLKALGRHHEGLSDRHTLF